VRLRFANTFGNRAVTFDGLFVGLQGLGGNVARGTNRRVTFGGKEAVTIPGGQSAWSDPLTIDFVDVRHAGLLDGRRLAVSFHVVGASGPMTWHAKADISADEVIEGMREVVRRVRARGGIRIYGATLTSSLQSTSAAYGTTDVDRKRRAVNDFIRSSGVFDGVFDFDAATIDRETGTVRAEFQPNSTVGGAGDLLHPNRAGQLAMASAIDLKAFQR